MARGGVADGQSPAGTLLDPSHKRRGTLLLSLACYDAKVTQFPILRQAEALDRALSLIVHCLCRSSQDEMAAHAVHSLVAQGMSQRHRVGSDNGR